MGRGRSAGGGNSSQKLLREYMKNNGDLPDSVAFGTPKRKNEYYEAVNDLYKATDEDKEVMRTIEIEWGKQRLFVPGLGTRSITGLSNKAIDGLALEWAHDIAKKIRNPAPNSSYSFYKKYALGKK